MLKRLAARLGVVALVASAAVILPAPTPATAATGDGIVIDQYAYQDENGAWLADLANNCPDVEYVVLNIGNGTTNDVGHLDQVAQDIMACGIKVYGYVNVWSGGAMRSAFDIDTDINRWVNPFNPERNVGGRMVDGIFFDQYPSLCGPVETPTNSTGNDADYVLRADSVTDYVHDVFAFWSYPTPTVVANVGTAVWGCHPGWEALSGHPMPDIWVTWENSYANLGSWAGGNMITGTFPASGSYVDGNSYYSGAFRHIVYGVSGAAEMENAVDTAEARGAAGVFVTDDVAANPYDVEPSFLEGSIHWAANPFGYRLDYTNDFVHGVFTGTDYIGVIRNERPGNPCDNPGTPGTVERCPYPSQGLEIIYNTVDAVCSGSWGTAGHTLGESGGIYDPDSTQIGCARALAEDGTGRDPVGVICSAARDWADEDATNNVADCQDDDDTGNYTDVAPATGSDTTVFRSVFFSTDTRAKAILVYARERMNGTLKSSDFPAQDANCVIGRWDVATPLPFRICP